MKYLLDTNVLIEAKNGFYAFDLCPGFWSWIKSYPDMKSIRSVQDEILNGNDDLSSWIKSELPDYFIDEDENIQKEYQKVAKYVDGLSDFKREKKDEFLSKADGWLIAAAIKENAIIVTHENYDPACKKKILLPVIAEHFHVKCVKITNVLRENRVKFS